MVKLFNRLYEPTSGQILLDGRPLSAYKVADVRRSMAILRQDHMPYPVSIRENIEFGLPGCTLSREDVEDAARKGGAAKFIEKLDKKYDTVLHPTNLSEYHGDDNSEEEEQLKKLLDGVATWTNISGGECQRLAA